MLLLLQVLVSCLWLGHSEVVTSFESSCPQFFFQNTPPDKALDPDKPAQICQRYMNQYYYATLYDRKRRIPVYSAYIYNPKSSKRPNKWLVEPQLIGLEYPKDMKNERTLLEEFNVTLEQLRESQAILQDYKNLMGLSRGHLNPSSHQPNFSSRTATFTLTNIVPQDEKLNEGAWKIYEQKTMMSMTRGCNTTYVVVGAVPGNNYIANGRVNKPSYIWSAACCKVDTIHTESWKSWAVIAENDRNAVQSLTLGELETRLAQLYNKNQVFLFHRSCPRS
ncbi:endonuclease domain-containing 1 protein-like [Phalacrocorax aristotelis]|uniref:endonuclease domain-containing 1 protein-like n=1 Tax=Phalacrocorax aristotelis TaxID=126867 RepID=UPI003F4BC59D